MKLFDCDWSEITQIATHWDRLPFECKRLFIEHVDANRRLGLEQVGIDCAPLVKEGFCKLTQGGNHLLLPRRLMPFRRVVRAMARLAVFSPDPEQRPGLVEYLSEHFSYDDQHALCESPYGYGDSRRKLAEQIGRQSWLRRFLAEDDFVRWDASYRSDRRTPLFYNEEVFQKAKEILTGLIESTTNPRTLLDLAGSHGQRLPLCFGSAVRALVGFGLTFPGFSYPDMALSIGIWPAVHSGLHRKAPTLPKPVTPDDQVSVAFLIHDMTTLLVACTAEPIRLRSNDWAMFAKTARDLESRLLALPEWLTVAVTYTAENRLQQARAALHRMRLSNIQGVAGKDLSLVANEKGQQWLGLSDAEKLRAVLDEMRKDLHTSLSRYYHYDWDETERFPCFERIPAVLNKRNFVDVREAAIEAYANCSTHQSIRLADFTLYQAEQANPYIRMQESGTLLSCPEDWNDNFGLDDYELVDKWREMLTWFFIDRLVPLGCVTVGVSGDGNLTFTVTEVSRYLAGESQSLEYGATEHQEVIVQPNFEVVFLAASPSAEAAVAQLAERVGSGLGVLFKITNTSVYEAVATGLDVTQIIDRLATISSKPIPKNVDRQIRDWAKQCRKIQISTAVLLECPDKETALKVKSVGGKKLSLISDTTVALSDRKALKTIEKKLRKNGITRQ